MAIGPTALFGEPFDDFGAGEDFAFRLRQRLALLARHHIGDRINPLSQQIGSLSHHLRPVMGRNIAPNTKPFVGSGKRKIKIGSSGMSDPPDHLFGGRVVDIDGLAGQRIAPFAINEEFDVGIIVHGDSWKMMGFHW
jgi:hypothetical protein